MPKEEEGEEDVPHIVREDLRHRQFQYLRGSKVHCFPRAEAPWPMAYDREILELSLMDSPLIQALRDCHSFVEFHGKNPRRCLDLGTAVGNWVVDTARTFPECTFVGFDLMDIQTSLKYVEPSVANRITWVHGNFLKFPLPFEDDEFDYIHLSNVALAVPEHKWSPLFEELNRILSPSGVIEMLQQDARFPVLPRWFTDPLHDHLWLPQAGRQNYAHNKYIPIREVSRRVPHAYGLLEELFNSVFDSRFINRTPSAILPSYFMSAFSKVISPPALSLSMPPIAPPISKSLQARPAPPPSGTTSDPLDPSAYFIPNPDRYSMIVVPPSPTVADSASIKSDTTFSASIFKELDMPDETKMGAVKNEEDFTDQPPPVPPKPSDPRRLVIPPLERIRTTSLFLHNKNPSTGSLARSRTPSSLSLSLSPSSPRRERPTAQLSLKDTTQLGGEAATSNLFRVERLLEMGEGALYMHLYQASRTVFAVKEAMWDELKGRMEEKDEGLVEHGWKTCEDYQEEESRRRFDGLLEGYKHDMGIRLSFWHSLLRRGWGLPAQTPLSGAEIGAEDKLRQAILEARKNATEEEFHTPVRTLRLLIGVKRS
ncbi:hypothetical protein BC835DRAFT_1263900 [Cytidiella melzeri]|nr:hypothetical protein BC835DRAFT_1263900 [Cytidiella melzeri]